MIFKETKLKGSFFVQIEKMEDERGFFSRAWCKEEFEAHGLRLQPVQANIAFSRKKGTLRGMHYQISPAWEAKLVRCIKGSIFDVIIDLRPDSPTYRHWVGLELTADNHKMVYAPEGFAHGFQTLDNDTEVFYQMSEYYHPESARGVRWDDSAFGINWPEDKCVISAKDDNYPDYEL